MFENVPTVFSHLHLKFAVSAIMTQKNCSGKLSIWVSQKPRKKLKAKNHEKMRKNENTQNSHSFSMYGIIGVI